MRIAALFLACAGACLAQLDDNTVTITATRTVTLQPDQAVVGISLTLPATNGLDDALAAVPAAGLTAGDLTGVQSWDTYQGAFLVWQFSKTVAFSDLKNVLPALAAAQQKLESQKGGDDLTYYVNGQVSQQAQQASVCPLPTLFADAQAQAQQVAQAAGVQVGGVVSLSQGAGAQVAALWFRTGDFSAVDATTIGGFANFLLASPLPAASPGCSLTVQFRVTR